MRTLGRAIFHRAALIFYNSYFTHTHARVRARSFFLRDEERAGGRKKEERDGGQFIIKRVGVKIVAKNLLRAIGRRRE